MFKRLRHAFALVEDDALSARTPFHLIRTELRLGSDKTRCERSTTLACTKQRS
jgi:hypothetical protein